MTHERLHVTFSNRVEVLYETLKQQLFRSGTHPFARRYVIVPSPAMKQWLTQRLADDLGIAAGIEIDHLESGLGKLMKLTTPENFKVPNSLELSFAIEAALRDAVTEREHIDETTYALWEPLFNYLKIYDASPTLTRKGETRLTALAGQIAHYFMQYGKYGRKMVAEWHQRDSRHWQEHLWKQIFKTDGWHSAYELLDNMVTPQLQHAEIHLFAISYLSQLQHDLLRHLSQHFTVDTYLLSPCQMFWSDVRSDREARRLQGHWKHASEQQQETLEELLRDRNPLLANFGRLGREMAEQIEKSNAVSTECYIAPPGIAKHPQYHDLLFDHHDDSEEPLTLIQVVQADMLFQRTPNPHDRIDINDNTIQVHISSSKLREVENLYDALVKIIDSDNIAPHDIIVMAPNIMDYEPYIKSVFGKEESVLRFQIMDLKIPSQSIFIQSFLHLLSLPKGRWNAADLLQLLDYAPFRRKHNISSEEVQTIREWTQESGIRWGYDADDRNARLKRAHFRSGMADNSNAGTWKFGFSRLLNSIAADDEETLSNVDTSQCDTLGKFIHLISSLRADLDLFNNGTKGQIGEWATYLLTVIDSYLQHDPTDQQEARDRKLLIDHITRIRNAGHAARNQRFPFGTVEKHLTESLNREESCYHENLLSGVRFCSMLPMRALPAQVVALMGMQEGAYPKRDLNSSLNMLLKHPESDYCPSQTDYDRYLFLETLLSARRYFLISYPGQSSQANQQIPPSLLVSELLSYIDHAYTASSESCVYQHPHHSFDAHYFSQDSNIPSFSLQRYSAATSYYAPNKRPQHRFIDTFAIKTSQQEIENIIDIKNLIAIAKNPLKVFFNKTLGLYIDQADAHEIKTEENFALSPLESGMLRKAAITKDFDTLLTMAEKQGILPLGLFKKVAIEKLKQDFDQIKAAIKEYNIVPEQLATIHLSAHHEAIEQKDDNTWYVPALQLPNAIITGTISHISSQGLLSYIKNENGDIFKAWPEHLVINSIASRYQIPIGTPLLPLKSDNKYEARQFDGDSDAALASYIDYYHTAKNNPSPLIPEWIPYFLLDDHDTAKSKIISTLDQERSSTAYNQYLNWCIDKRNLPDLDEMIDSWKDLATKNFQPAHDQWF
ncbi:MAG: exodeoxyribonuclease V subunit gamma [Chlamydiia bacterium]|nr:exodeoxyribonuclease V subunit gamma [Chlamydiia bacterium]